MVESTQKIVWSHDPNSPSRLKQRKMCPGSLREESAVEPWDTEGKDYAIRGKLLHEFCQKAMETGDIPSTPEGLNESDIEDALWCIGHVRNTIDMLEVEGYETTIVYEHQVDLNHLGISTSPDGNRLDVMIIVKYEGQNVGAVVVDYKFGQSYVDPVQWNLQLKAYCNGVWRAFGGQWVRGVILQPAAGTPDAMFSEFQFNDEQLKFAEEEIIAIIEATKCNDAPLVRGRHCDFCRAKNVCPMFREVVLGVPRHVDIAKHVTQISPADRTILWEKLAALESFTKNARQNFKKVVVEQGLEMDGYEVGEGRSSSVWASEEAATEMLMKLCKQVNKDVAIRKLITVGEAKRKFGASKAVTEAMAQHIVVVPGNPTVVKSRRK